jgi:hypothetical protein
LTPVLGHVNEDHVVPELQLLEDLSGLVMTPETMDRERRLAASSSMPIVFVGSPRFAKAAPEEPEKNRRA